MISTLGTPSPLGSRTVPHEIVTDPTSESRLHTLMQKGAAKVSCAFPVSDGREPTRVIAEQGPTAAVRRLQ